MTQAASQAAAAQQEGAGGQPSPRQQPGGVTNPSPYPATPDLAQPQNGHRNLELVFVHDCRSDLNSNFKLCYIFALFLAYTSLQKTPASAWAQAPRMLPLLDIAMT